MSWSVRIQAVSVAVDDACTNHLGISDQVQRRLERRTRPPQHCRWVGRLGSTPLQARPQRHVAAFARVTFLIGKATVRAERQCAVFEPARGPGAGGVPPVLAGQDVADRRAVGDACVAAQLGLCFRPVDSVDFAVDNEPDTFRHLLIVSPR